MDKDSQGKNWKWLPAQMPGVARLMAEKRKQFGAEHVQLCWRRGVVELQPGWFFAREGALGWVRLGPNLMWPTLRRCKSLPRKRWW